MEWDTLVWNASSSEEENELQLTIQGTCSDIDEDVFRQLQNRGVEVTSISIRPKATKAEDLLTANHWEPQNRSDSGRWHPTPR